MAESPDDRSRVQRLLAQDQDINDAQLKEFRMNLEATLVSWEERSERVRRWLIRSVTILVLGYLGILLSMMSAGPGRMASADATWAVVHGIVHWVFVISTLGSLLAAIWLAIAYFVKYVPALRRARFDTHTAMMLELQEQVVHLRQDLAKRDERSPGET